MIDNDEKSIQNGYFIIHFSKAFESDAVQVLEYCSFSREATLKVYPHRLSAKIHVYLYDLLKSRSTGKEMCTRVGRGNNEDDEIFLLAPSAVPNEDRDKKDKIWFQRNIVHEYVHIPTYKDLYRVRWCDSASGDPQWITNGIAEYIALFHTTGEIFERYKYYYDSIKNVVNQTSGRFKNLDMEKRNNARDAFLMKYTFDEYGRNKAYKLFKTDASSIEEAVKLSLNISYQEFENNWIKWIHTELKIDKNRL